MKSVFVTPTAGAKSEVLSLPGLFIVVQTSQSRAPAKKAKKAKTAKPKAAKPKKAAPAPVTKVKKSAGKKKPHTASTAPSAKKKTPAIPKHELDQARTLRQGLADIKKFLKK